MCLHININSNIKKSLPVLESWVVSQAYDQQEERSFPGPRDGSSPSCLYGVYILKVLLQLTETGYKALCQLVATFPGKKNSVVIKNWKGVKECPCLVAFVTHLTVTHKVAFMIEGIRHPWTCRAFPSHNRRKAWSFWIHSLLAVRGGMGHWLWLILGELPSERRRLEEWLGVC